MGVVAMPIMIAMVRPEYSGMRSKPNAHRFAHLIAGLLHDRPDHPSHHSWLHRRTQGERRRLHSVPCALWPRDHRVVPDHLHVR